MIYVGCSIVDNTYQVFRSSVKPTEESHGDKFKYIIGAFRTLRGAKVFAKYGKNNPHMSYVADAEALAKSDLTLVV